VNISDIISGTRGDIPSLLSLLDGSMIAQGIDTHHREQSIRFHSEENLRQLLVVYREKSFPSLIVTSSSVLFRSISPDLRRDMPGFVPIVPNIRGIMREAVEFGMIKAGMRRALRVGMSQLVSLGLRSIGKAGSILHKDFPTLLSCLIELEIAEFRRFTPPLFLLQAQMTDLAVAMDNPRMVEGYIRVINRRTSAGIGYETFNFTRTVNFLERWGLGCDAIITPWDRNGSHMRESVEECLRARKRCGYPVWGMQPGRFTPPEEKDRACVEEAGLAGMVRDDYEIWGLK
jgi:hypothetical protein